MRVKLEYGKQGLEVELPTERVVRTLAYKDAAPLSDPTGDLDRDSASNILDLLRALVRDHAKTIVMVTHDAKAAAAADRILHLEKGRLLEQEAMATAH